MKTCKYSLKDEPLTIEIVLCALFRDFYAIFLKSIAILYKSSDFNSARLKHHLLVVSMNRTGLSSLLKKKIKSRERPL